MIRVILLTLYLVIAGRVPTVCQPVVDSISDTTIVIQHAGESDSVDIDSTQVMPEPNRTGEKDAESDSNATDSTQTAPEQNRAAENDPVHALHSPADSAAASAAQSMPPASKHSASSDTGRACRRTGFITPDYAGEYYLGKNYRLPEGDLFLLGGTEQFIVKKQLSKNIAIGMSGGPAFRSSLLIPYSYIDNTQYTVRDSIEKRRGIYANLYSHYYSDNYYYSENGTIENIPFGRDEFRDDGYFWMESTRKIDFVGIELSSLQWYLNARLPNGTFSLMIKPLAFGRHIISRSALYLSKYDTRESTMLFSKEGEISADFAVRNYGIRADAALTRRVTDNLSLYARCPVEYRRIITDETRSIAAQFNYYSERDMNDYYTRYVKLDTFEIAAYHGSSYSFSPRLGIRLDSEKDLAWPFVFLPFVAQKGTFEGYFYGRKSTWYPKNFLYKKAGCSYTSFQNIRFGNRFFTGMENLLGANAELTYYDRHEYYYDVYAEYTPQLIIKERFFVSGIRLSTQTDIASYISFYLFTRLGFGYCGKIWGISLSVAPAGLREGLNQNNYQDAVSLIIWRGWK
jgi:hypothetical protein